jgi:hypothetical protein
MTLLTAAPTRVHFQRVESVPGETGHQTKLSAKRPALSGEYGRQFAGDRSCGAS